MYVHSLHPVCFIYITMFLLLLLHRICLSLDKLLNLLEIVYSYTPVQIKYLSYYPSLRQSRGCGFYPSQQIGFDLPTHWDIRCLVVINFVMQIVINVYQALNRILHQNFVLLYSYMYYLFAYSSLQIMKLVLYNHMYIQCLEWFASCIPRPPLFHHLITFVQLECSTESTRVKN